jgi:RNA polymerase sigma-70 factor (ECF subfamily)
VGAADIELVRGTLAGSARAFEDLVRRYERAVLALVGRMVRDSSRAEELAQDVFVKAFTALHTYDVRRRFSTWLLAIARNVAIDELRRRPAGVRALEDVDPAGGNDIPDVRAATPVQLAERAELSRAIDRAIERLRDDYRELVVLRYQLDLEIDEIAAVTGLPAGTIKSSLYRARQELARHLRAAGYDRAGR